jgi:exosortase family protein XrtF
LSGATYIKKWNKVPVGVKQFLLRALIILIAWKVLYLAFLLPTRLLDKPLSYSVAKSSAWLLNFCTRSADYSTRSEDGNVSTDNGITVMPLENIYYHQRDLVSIEDGCNALELFVLYAGFIICMPALPGVKALFITCGIILIYTVNVIRCAGIAYIILYYPRYADFAHHYVFTFIVYGLIIALWLIFSKRVTLSNARIEK